MIDCRIIQTIIFSWCRLSQAYFFPFSFLHYSDTVRSGLSQSNILLPVLVLCRLSAKVYDVKMWKWRSRWLTIGPRHPEETGEIRYHVIIDNRAFCCTVLIDISLSLSFSFHVSACMPFLLHHTFSGWMTGKILKNTHKHMFSFMAKA